MPSLPHQSKKILPLLGVFFGIWGLFLGIDLLLPHFIGSDVYYHLKHALLIQESQTWGYVSTWIPYHFLGTMPVDPYILHHTVLAVLLHFLSDPFFAATLYAAMFSAGVYTAFYIAIRRLQVPAPLLYTLAFLISSPIFIYRLLLDRPFTISIIASIIAVPLLLKQKHITLFFVSIIAILSYNLAMFLLPTTVLYLAVTYWQTKQLTLRPLIAVLGGLLVGLLLHPDTINYVHLIFVHLFSVFSLKLSGIVLPLGSEIMHPGILNTIITHMWTLLFVLLSCIATARLFMQKKLGTLQLPILFTANLQFLWLPVMLYVPRGTEYWVPFAWLFISVSVAAIWQAYPTIFQKISWQLRIVGLLILGISMINSTSVLLINQLPNQTVEENHRASLLALTNELSAYPSTVLFYPSWHLFTELFFALGESHQYIAGFDPTHTYTYNQDMYHAWYSISTQGEYCITDTCTDSRVPLRIAVPLLFESNVIIVPKQDRFFALSATLTAEDIPLVFENDAYKVYRIDN